LRRSCRNTLAFDEMPCCSTIIIAMS
jgi:hypothetical protein